MAVFKSPTVDSIMSAFVKTVTDLENLAENKQIESERHAEAIREATNKRDAAQNEASRAIAISMKLTKLISE